MNPSSNIHAFIAELEEHTPTLRALGAELCSTVEAKLVEARLSVHFVTWRLKGSDSLRHKLSRPDRTYSRLWDVTDLIGIRVATYFEDAIDSASRLVEDNFHVDFRHSSNKSRFTDAGKFGYRSVHYVCKAPTGASPSADFRFEIQLRTALQHAWAEVEHDLGYKANDVVPDRIRRRFSRIASLLEIADEEFVSIRSDMQSYRTRVQEAIAVPTESLPLDQLSFEAIARNPVIGNLDANIAAALRRPLDSTPFFPTYLVRLLRMAGLDTTSAVLAAAQQHAPELPATVSAYAQFARHHLGLDLRAIDAVKPGYTLFFVAHLVVVRGNDLGLGKVATLARMYRELDGLAETDAVRTASALLAALSPQHPIDTGAEAD